MKIEAIKIEELEALFQSEIYAYDIKIEHINDYPKTVRLYVNNKAMLDFSLSRKGLVMQVCTDTIAGLDLLQEDGDLDILMDLVYMLRLSEDILKEMKAFLKQK